MSKFQILNSRGERKAFHMKEVLGFGVTFVCYRVILFAFWQIFSLGLLENCNTKDISEKNIKYY